MTGIFLFLSRKMHQISLEQFQGPLDLLLQLIEKDKLQITEISLAKITDQYLEYIDSAQNIASAEVADFLLIASKLIYLKSKYLLPEIILDGEETAGDLENQLKIYRQYYEASKEVDKLFLDKKSYAYLRQVPYKLPIEIEFLAPKNVSKNILADIFREVLAKIDRVVNLPKVAIARAISIGEKIQQIKDQIKQFGKLSFKSILKKKDKMETIISFLAMLELVKQREIVVDQDKLFGDLSIAKRKEIEF
ncbi:MAG: segregation/condensation protein A [bacterium]|nr:segregation/condensation protein A [bacterium]